MARSFIGKYFGKVWIFIVVTIIFIINFISASIALQCNKNESGFVRFGSAIFAFCFGFLYILLNFYSYRLMTLHQLCEWDAYNPFPL